MPSPLPISFQFDRSPTLPCAKRGNHASGTEMVRPSVRSMVKMFSLTLTRCAVGYRRSILEVVMHALHNNIAVIRLYSSRASGRDLRYLVSDEQTGEHRGSAEAARC